MPPVRRHAAVNGLPHWLAQTDSRPPSAASALPGQAEVVVVGGGVMGMSVAYWLARQGTEVLVLEARGLAWGASSRNAGIMLAGLRPLEDPALVTAVLADEGIDADYTVVGHLALASSPATWDAFQAEAARRSPIRPLHALQHPDCEEVAGCRIGEQFIGGRWDPRGALIDPVRFVLGLAAAATRYGATLRTWTPVLEVRLLAGQDRQVVETARGNVVARHIVFACSSGVVRFVPALAPAIVPSRGQVLATAPLLPLFHCGLAVDWGAVYWRQATDGAIVLGGYRGLDPEREIGTNEVLHDGIQASLERFLPQAFPSLPPIHVTRRWAGIMDVTPDGQPLIGCVRDGSNWWLICGFGGHGLPAGLGAGRALATSIGTGQAAAALGAYAPGRLLKGGVA
jgi:gamma-glutamylputrescine oxidase